MGETTKRDLGRFQAIPTADVNRAIREFQAERRREKLFEIICTVGILAFAGVTLVVLLYCAGTLG